MVGYKTIKDVNLNGQRTFMRVDFNILDEQGNVGSIKRIKEALPSIQYAVEHGARLILASHVQRPGGKIVEKWRMAPIKKELESLLNGKEVGYVNECIGPKVEKAVSKMNKGEILLLENLRFYAEEEANDPIFVEQLAEFVDVYILDGFAVSHRAHASTVGLPLYLLKQGKQVAAGCLMEKEIKYWSPLATGEPGGIAIIGGAKLNEKILATSKFPEKFDKVVVGGVVANVFLKSAGYGIGKSKYTEKDEKTGEEKDYTDKAKKALDTYSAKIVLPTKVILDDKSEVNSSAVPPERSILDNLLENSTIEAIRSAPRVAIFGAMGKFEEGYTKGTDQLVTALKGYQGLLKVGGGDAEKALKEKLKVTMSTGGGASIEYVIYGKLPGLEALEGRFFDPKAKKT